jgi:hypothetical protein
MPPANTTNRQLSYNDINNRSLEFERNMNMLFTYCNTHNKIPRLNSPIGNWVLRQKINR